METCLRCYAILVCLTLAPLTAGWTTALAHETHTSEAVDQTAPAVSTNQARGSQDKPEPRSPTGRLSDAFPNILLWTQDNTPVRFYDDLVKDKIVIINFMYTTCSDICPGTAQNLTYVHELLGKRVGRDIHILSISIEPQIDTPEALK